MLRHPMGAHEPEVVIGPPEEADYCEQQDCNDQHRPDCYPEHLGRLPEDERVRCLRSRSSRDTRFGRDGCSRRATPNRAIRQLRIRAVWRHTQKRRLDRRIKDCFVQRPLKAAEALRLFKGQSQARHSQLLGADPVKQVLEWHETSQRNQAAAADTLPRSSRSACNQSSTSCPCSQPRARKWS
jgi:hypothetical protein